MRQLNSDGIIIFIEGFPKNQSIHWIVRLLIMQDKYILSSSLSLYSLSLRESWHYNHSVPPHHPPQTF